MENNLQKTENFFENDNFTETRLRELQSKLQPNQLIVLKFTASWCGPCKSIQSICETNVKDIQSQFPGSLIYCEIDIDDSLELYMRLKKVKMLNGIPSLLAYYSGARDFWYIPNDSQLGGDKKKTQDFFNRCIMYIVS